MVAVPWLWRPLRSTSRKMICLTDNPPAAPVVIPDLIRDRAPASVLGQRGVSPLMAYTLRPLVDCNCVAGRRGGEQQEASNQSVA